MKNWVASAILAASLGVGAAGAQQPTNFPGPANTYPFIANQIGMPGEVILKCMATPEGRVDLCSVAKETPTGFGFGVAALRNAPNVRVEPAKATEPSARPVLVPQRFRHPIPAHMPPVTSPGALVIARTLPSLLAPIDQSLLVYDSAMDRVLTDASADVPANIRIAAAAAMRDALRAKLDELHESAAVVIASVYSEDELRSVAAFHNTPVGRRYSAAGADQAFFRMKLREHMSERIDHAAGHFYCVTRDCGLDLKTSNPTFVVWINSPEAWAIASAQPKLSLTLGLPSRASLDCAMGKDSHPNDCKVVAQAPAGLGVGVAAQSFARSFTAGPGEAQRLSGKRVTILVDFPATPDPPPMAKAPPPTSPRAMALAEEIQRKTTTPELHDRWIKEAMSFVPSAWLAGLSDADRQAYLAAREHGLVEVHGQIDASLTQLLANRMNEDDLAAASKFADTLGGVALRDKARKMEDGYRWLSPQLFLIVAAEARARYCKAMPCDLPAWALPQRIGASSAPSTRTP